MHVEPGYDYLDWTETCGTNTLIRVYKSYRMVLKYCIVCLRVNDTFNLRAKEGRKMRFATLI